MRTIETLIDELGATLAAQAELNKQVKSLKDEFMARVEAGDVDEGELFRAFHVLSERKATDWKAVAQKLQPSRQLVAAHTSQKFVHSVRVSSKTGE
jgi:hypothetical protein